MPVPLRLSLSLVWTALLLLSGGRAWGQTYGQKQEVEREMRRVSDNHSKAGEQLRSLQGAKDFAAAVADCAGCIKEFLAIDFPGQGTDAPARGIFKQILESEGVLRGAISRQERRLKEVANPSSREAIQGEIEKTNRFLKELDADRREALRLRGQMEGLLGFYGQLGSLFETLRELDEPQARSSLLAAVQVKLRKWEESGSVPTRDAGITRGAN